MDANIGCLKDVKDDGLILSVEKRLSGRIFYEGNLNKLWLCPCTCEATLGAFQNHEVSFLNLQTRKQFTYNTFCTIYLF